MDNAWKKLERRAAADHGLQRNPLSGYASGHGTGADLIRRPNDYRPLRLHFECKWRKQLGLWTEYEKARDKAIAEGKVPVMIWGAYRKRGYLYVVHRDDVDLAFAEIVRHRLDGQRDTNGRKWMKIISESEGGEK